MFYKQHITKINRLIQFTETRELQCRVIISF